MFQQKYFRVPVKFLQMSRHFLMYIQWLPVLVHMVCHFCLLIKNHDLTNDEALTGTLYFKDEFSQCCLFNQEQLQYTSNGFNTFNLETLQKK